VLVATLQFTILAKNACFMFVRIKLPLTRLEAGLTPITASQQYAKICIFSEQKWYKQFTRLFSMRVLILQAIKSGLQD